MKRLIYKLLSNKFYQKHANHKEILQKQRRPYCIIVIQIDGINIGIPFRSHIKHKYAFFTEAQRQDIQSRAGLDYTKSVVLNLEEDLSDVKAIIRKEDYKALLGREYRVTTGFLKFLKRYKEAVKFPNRPENKFIVQNSSLQYFHKELNIEG